MWKWCGRTFLLVQVIASNGLEIESNSDEAGDGTSQIWEKNKRMGVLTFPDDNEEVPFCERVLTAVQNWFSLFGWSKGMHSISIPYSLRRSEKAEILDLDKDLFESASKRAWTDVLLQIYKVKCDISKTFSYAKYMDSIPKINPDSLASNIYSAPERCLLTWLNIHYENMRHHVWKDCQKGGIPAMRWVINFDANLLDSLVLAAVLAHYCPSMISTHFVNMYTFPSSPEQYLHNSLVFLNAFHTIGLNFDIQVTEMICLSRKGWEVETEVMLIEDQLFIDNHTIYFTLELKQVFFIEYLYWSRLFSTIFPIYFTQKH
uniref:Calponin-homology (CH) domain-containing protein n=1 Tax=Callorhinchus milii TaxID=7868 RepID=A0A4W3IXA4_CALMI